MFQLDRKNPPPLFQQLIDQVIQQIQEGTLQPGDKLPPERKLAQQLNINRSTVNRAMDELVSLGWITRKQGSGTEVTRGRWGARQTPDYQWRRFFQNRTLDTDPYIRQINQHKKTALLDLYTGDLPLKLIPDFKFPAVTWDTVIQEEEQVTPYGYQPLLEVIQTQLHHNLHLPFQHQKLLLTAGSTQGISLVAQTLLQAGDCIAVEDPSFLFALPLFQSLGIRMEGIPCDNEGMLPQALEQKIFTNNIKLVYLNPTFQNPTGRTMSLKRRQEILSLCAKYYLPIIEDDVFGELAFGDSPPKMKTLAPDQVIYLGSLSKIFGSSIKIGWLLAPEKLMENLVSAKQRLELEGNLFPQLLANTALRSSDYQQSQQALLRTIQHRSQNFANRIAPLRAYWRFQAISGGLYYWLTWQGPALVRSDWDLFLKHQVLIAPSFLFSDDTMAMRVNYTRMDQSDLAYFGETLQQITNELLERKLTDERNH